MSLITNWQRIDVFDEKIEWHKNLAIEVHDICYEIAKEFYEKNKDAPDDYCSQTNRDRDDGYTTYSWFYKDSVVKLDGQETVYLHSSPSRIIYNRSVKVNLLPSYTQVFSSSIKEYEHIRPFYEIQTFRVGSWLNHIESLRLKLEPIKQEKEQAMRLKQEQERQRNFGRL